jgi:hypothetical protein
LIVFDDQTDEEFVTEVERPLRDLLLLMPHLQVRTASIIDYQSAEPALVHQVGINANVTMRIVHRGTAAIGRLLVAVYREGGNGPLPADCVQALGVLLAEMGDLADTCHSIAASCQRYTADYNPRTPKVIPNARP